MSNNLTNLGLLGGTRSSLRSSIKHDLELTPRTEGNSCPTLNSEQSMDVPAFLWLFMPYTDRASLRQTPKAAMPEECTTLLPTTGAFQPRGLAERVFKQTVPVHKPHTSFGSSNNRSAASDESFSPSTTMRIDMELDNLNVGQLRRMCMYTTSAMRMRPKQCHSHHQIWVDIAQNLN